METVKNSIKPSKGALLTGRIIGILCILFLLFDAFGKIFKESHSVSGTIAMGFPESFVSIMGAILLVCTILYIIPRTAVIGAVFLTAYLGAAVACMIRLGIPYYFPIAFASLLWVGLYLRDTRVRQLI